MSITSEQIEHIAYLSRIDLDAETKKTLERDLPGILSFVETLNEIDTAGIEPVNGGTLLENVMRPDEVVDAYMEKKSVPLMDAVPEKNGNLVRVKSVFEQ